MYSLNTLEKLYSAIKTKNIKTIRSIFSKDPEIFCLSAAALPEGMPTPLWQALLSGHKKIIELFIREFKADPNERYLFEPNKYYNLTFLQCLAFHGDFWNCGKVAEILIKYGGDVNADWCSRTKKTPLEIAIEEGNVEYAKFLFEKGAQIRSVQCLLRAPKIKQKYLLQLVIRQGQIHQDKPFNYLLLAIWKVIEEPNLDFDIVEISRILLDAGMPVNQLDSLGNSALHFAVKLQNIDLVSLLIERGANVNSKSKDKGIVPLLLACQSQNILLVDLLISKGADVNAKTNTGVTALHSACYQRNKILISLLLQKSADFRGEDQIGRTPFFILQLNNEPDILCINLMIKEMARRKFLDYQTVSQKDVDLIQNNLILQECFHKHVTELSQMSNSKFYNYYSYLSVLKMSKNIKKLAHLTKNEEFSRKFLENLHIFPIYENDLRFIFEEASKVKDQLNTIETKLKITLGDFLPDVIIRKLANNLSVEDLSKQ